MISKITATMVWERCDRFASNLRHFCAGFFLHSDCNHDTILYLSPHFLLLPRQEVKINGPDYRGIGDEDALRDFLQRIEHYKRNYEPLDEKKEKSLSFMKIFNTGELCWLLLLAFTRWSQQHAGRHRFHRAEQEPDSSNCRLRSP